MAKDSILLIEAKRFVSNEDLRGRGKFDVVYLVD